MNESELKEIAKQLRKPQGEYAKEVGKKMNEGNHQMNMRTIQELNLTDHQVVLEIGMGNGFFVKEILQRGKNIKYYGCDYSQEMIDEAHKLNKSYIESGQTTFMLSEAQKLPFNNNFFDKIFTVNTIYFRENPKAVLQEFKRILKPKGSLIITLRSKDVMLEYPMTKYNFTMYNQSDIETLAKESGYTILGCKNFEFTPQEFLNHKMRDQFLILTTTK